MQPSRRYRRRIGVALRAEARPRYELFSDPILVRRARDGDTLALEALCARHAPRVARIAAHLLADPEDAHDAAQDALTKLCTKIGQFRGEAAFTTWLHRLTATACSDLMRRRVARRQDPFDDNLQVAGEPGPEAEAELSYLRTRLRRSLEELPVAQARVLVLKDALGFSFDEISAASGMPVGTAKCYAHRARATMRELLDVAESA